MSKKLFNFKIIYGGSVNSKNSKLISKIKIVNGALIGGSSLKVNEFKQIINWLSSWFKYRYKYKVR